MFWLCCVVRSQAAARDSWNKLDEWSDAPRSPLEKQARRIARGIKAGVVDDQDARDREAQARAEAAERYQRQQAEVRRAWEELLESAKVKAKEQLRRSTFGDAYGAWRTSREIRSFCDALEAAIPNEEPAEQASLRAWIA